MKIKNVASVICLFLASITLTTHANHNITTNATSNSFESFDLNHIVESVQVGIPVVMEKIVTFA